MVAAAFYMWTAATSVPFSFNAANADPYNLMATGFLHGHLYLPIRPPAGLLHLSNPYDPLQNAPYQGAFHDLSLRDHRFYSPWGASPVLLFLVTRLTPFAMSESFAAALYSVIGLVCAVLLLRLLIRELVPRTPRWLIITASMGLALTNAAPFLLRRPVQYEVAISGGYCFLMLGLLLVVAAVLARPARPWRLAFGSLFLGLGILARPTLLIGVPVALAAALYLIRRRGCTRRVLIPALMPVLLCGCLLAVYNQARFGSPTELGQSYQLAGIDVHNKPTDQLSYIPPGVYSYLLLPARASLTFPHFFMENSLQYPFTLPAGYSGTKGVPIEPDGGMLLTMPITLLLVALLAPSMWRRPENRPTAVLIAGGTLASLAVVVLLSYGLWGTTQRYEVDFATIALIPAFVMWALLVDRAGPRAALRRTLAGIGLVLTMFGALVGTAFSLTGYAYLLELNHGGTFRKLEDITAPAATLATEVSGHAVLTRIDMPLAAGDDPSTLDVGAFSQGGGSAWLGAAGAATVTVISPHHERAVLAATPIQGKNAPGGGALAVVVSSAGESQIVVPEIGRPLRLPIMLDAGLNRIKVRLGRSQAGDLQELLLDGIQLRS